jgi:hypothetical protein
MKVRTIITPHDKNNINRKKTPPPIEKNNITEKQTKIMTLAIKRSMQKK